MLSLAIDTTAVKEFMNRLLREDGFDFFAVRNVELTLATFISVSGKLENENGDENKSIRYTTWGDIRSLVYDLIKRGTKPKLIKIIFSHPAPVEVHTNAAALFVNLTYEGDRVSFTTATAQREFALDKTLDAAWDDWMRKCFVKLNVNVTDNLEAN
ncbi:MAG: DUF5721 family protein [Defluviitaleaceae bacterium]|nr:DUF5721 family protein [Defluviitaleaceae bacterium]